MLSYVHGTSERPLIGETIGDLVPFDPDEFVNALFDQ